MRNRIIIFGIIILIVVVSVLMLNYNECDRVIYIDEKSNQVVNTNALTMMYETEAGSGEYQVSNDTNLPQEGYSFNEKLSRCENGGELSWNDETKRVIMKANTSDKCYIYFDKVLTLAEYITTQVYTGTDGDNGFYYHDGSGSYINADQEAGDNSYRYAGANPNNYVCFGSDAASCPADNLYRIIGVFGNQVKLIKHDYAGSNLLGTNGAYQGTTTSPGSYYKGSQSTLYWYYWNNSTNVNTWSESNLNTVNLNQNYLNNIGSKWSNIIAPTSWKVGGNTYQNIYNVPVKSAYENEIVSPAESTTYSAKVSLMYVSDYGYAASPDNWNTNLYDYDNDTNRNNNWMYMGWYDWTISRRSGSTAIALYVDDTGRVYYNGVFSSRGVRPSFYLESSVVLSGGSGTSADPYRIA